MICRVCDSNNLEAVVDLGDQPWCNHFLTKDEIGKEPKYPLKLLYCNDCSTTQLDYTVKKEIMFGDHTYLSGVTKSLSNHFKNIAKELNDRFCKNKNQKSVLDIGSNDGTQLKHFKDLGFDILGVESSKSTSKIANDNNLTTINSFFNYDLAIRLNKKFDIINAAGVFFHLEELHSVTKGIKESLKSDGVFLVQFLYMKRIVENLAFDQIYHEHLLYYNLKNLKILLNRHGLDIFDAYLSPIHGGSMMAFVSHEGQKIKSDRLKELFDEEERTKANEKETYIDFSNKIKKMKDENLAFLNKCKLENKRVWGMGAPVKGNTMLNYFDVGPDLIEYLIEKNELRKNLYSPGKHIPILIEKELDETPDVYYVLAWNFKEEILKNNKHLIDKGVKFYFPVNPKF
tara:strand:- start:7038 stop:8237 length:1200 start_codon:yes stop_codon:yes gene_type:complete